MKDHFILLNNIKNIDKIKENLFINYKIDIMQILKEQDKFIYSDSEIVNKLLNLCSSYMTHLSHDYELSTLECDYLFHLKQHCIIATLYNIEYLQKSTTCQISKQLFHKRFPHLGKANLYSGYAQTHSYEEATMAKSYINAVNYFCRKNYNYNTFTSNFLSLENISKIASQKLIVCPHYLFPITEYIFNLQYDLNLSYNVEYKPYSNHNSNYSTGNRNRAINNYLRRLDFMSNKLIDYSSIDDITKILYFYKVERAYGFQLLEQFIKHTNYNRTIETLIEYLSKSINKEFYLSENLYKVEFWNILSRFPNSFSRIEWIPFLDKLDLQQLNHIADFSFPLYEITFTITLLEYCNRSLETAQELLKSYINNKLRPYWNNVTDILEKKKVDYRMTKFNSKNELLPSSKNYLHISNAYYQNINIIKLIENGKIFVNLDNQKKENISILEHYLNNRYSKEWWATLPSFIQHWQ